MEKLNDGVKLTGELDIQVTNKFGEITHREITSNALTSDIVSALRNASVAEGYTWSGISFDSVCNAFDPRPAASTAVPSASDFQYTSQQLKTAMVVYNTASYTGYRAVMNGTIAASASSGVITTTANAGYNAGTWNSARLGVLDEFAGNGNGVETWINQYWAQSTFTQVVLTTDDTLTITWSITFT